MLDTLQIETSHYGKICIQHILDQIWNMEYGITVWIPNCKKDIKTLEKIQRRSTCIALLFKIFKLWKKMFLSKFTESYRKMNQRWYDTEIQIC
jgi:hypothetical protein